MTARRAVVGLRADGSTALASLHSQALTWGLVIAVGVVIASATAWAIASTHTRPELAARAKNGVLIAIVGALLLGASQGYLTWLSGAQAQGFTADPASYKADTAAPIPGVELIDKTSDWLSLNPWTCLVMCGHL